MRFNSVDADLGSMGAVLLPGTHSALAAGKGGGVFLVDLDLQRSQVGSYLGMNVDYGITDYLTGQCELDQCIYDIGVRRLAVIPNVRRAAKR